MITEDELRTLVRETLQARGSATLLQHDAGVSHAAASRAKHGKRIHDSIARHFGYKRVILYAPIE